MCRVRREGGGPTSGWPPLPEQGEGAKRGKARSPGRKLHKQPQKELQVDPGIPEIRLHKWIKTWWVFLVDLIILEQFYVNSKNEWKVQRFPIYSGPILEI